MMRSLFPNFRLVRPRVPCYSGTQRPWCIVKRPDTKGLPEVVFPRSSAIPLPHGRTFMVAEWDSNEVQYHDVLW